MNITNDVTTLLTNFLPGGIDCIKDCIIFIRKILIRRNIAWKNITKITSISNSILCSNSTDLLSLLNLSLSQQVIRIIFLSNPEQSQQLSGSSWNWFNEKFFFQYKVFLVIWKKYFWILLFPLSYPYLMLIDLFKKYKYK